MHAVRCTFPRHCVNDGLDAAPGQPSCVCGRLMHARRTLAPLSSWPQTQPRAAWPRRATSLHGSMFRVAADMLRESEAHARPTELEASRLASAATLRLSGMLRLCLAVSTGAVPAAAGGASSAPVALALRAWGLAVQLVEDEDDDVRCVLRVLCML